MPSLNDMLAAQAKKAGHKQPPTALEAPTRRLTIVDTESTRAQRWISAKVDAQVEALAAMPPDSGRNSALNATAYSLGRLAPKWLDPGEINDRLLVACMTNGLVAEDGQAQCEKTIRSGLDAGARDPRDPPVEDDRDGDDWISSLKERPSNGEPAPWEKPEPLALSVPPFPTHVFGWLAPTIEELADHLQTPVDIVAVITLATVAATVRGRALVRITETWTEPLNVYVVAVAGAGETKSPALAVITKPIRDLEAEMQDKAGAEVALAEQTRRVQEGRVAKAEKAAINATGEDRRVAEDQARVEAETLASMPLKPIPRLLASDVTAEGLVRLLAEQGGAIAALSAEGGLFDTLAGGRYSNGMANLDGVLQAHDGREPILVDRKVGPPIRVESPCLTLGLAVQPQVLQAAGGSEAAVGRGFLARFLYSVPASRVGTRRMRRKPVEGGFQGFDRVVKGVATLIRGSSVDSVDDFLKHELKFSLSTTETFYDYLSAIEPRRHPISGDLGGPGLGAWANKIDGQLARLAGLLHLVDLANTSTKSTEVLPEVPESAVRRACEVVDYLIGHAVVAHKLMAGEAIAASDDAVAVLEHVRKQGLAEFTVRDLHVALGGRTRFKGAGSAEKLHAACGVLTRHGYVRPQNDPDHTKGRPPSRYVVNPLGMEDA